MELIMLNMLNGCKKNLGFYANVNIIFISKDKCKSN